MADMRRLLTVLAFLAFPGCAVGPQEDIYIAPGDPDQRNSDAGNGAEVADGDADADADDDGLPPVDEAEYPDDGDFGAGAGEADPDAASVEDLEGATVPGLPGIPRPGVASPRPSGPDLDASDLSPDGADLDTVDGPGDDGRA